MISTSATLLEKQRSPNGTTVCLLFKTETKILFQEGQFVMIECQLPDGRMQKKPYSIATACHDMESDNLIGFYIKQEGEHGCSAYLSQMLEIGETVLLKGPVGHFTDDNISQNYLFISTGSGLAPNLSILRNLGHTGGYHKIAFLFGERNHDMMLLSILEQMQQGLQGDLQKEWFQLCYSQQSEGVEYDFKPGYVQTQIPHALQFLGSRTDLSVFMCGKPQMVDQSMALLLGLGVPRARITIEKY